MIEKVSPKATKLPQVYRKILALHLLGQRQVDIAQATGRTVWFVKKALHSEEMGVLRREELAVLDKELEALQGLVVTSLRSALQPEVDINHRLDAVDIWMKAHGKYKVTQGEGAVTAEVIVQQLVNIYNGVNPNKEVLCEQDEKESSINKVKTVPCRIEENSERGQERQNTINTVSPSSQGG